MSACLINEYTTIQYIHVRLIGAIGIADLDNS